MKKMSEKREWTNGTGRTNRKSGEMMNTRARGDQNNGKSGKNGGKPWTSTEKTLKSMDKKSAVQVTEHHGHAAKKNSLCPHFKSCGGCQYLDMPYEKQLEHKKEEVSDLLRPFCKVETIIGMDDPFHYRNKVHAVMARDRKGRIISGVYKEGTHTVLPVETCLIENKKADEIIGTIRELLPSFKMKVFDEDTGYGFLRHVLVRTAHATGEIMVVLITASPVFP